MKNRHVSFIVLNLVLCICVTYQFGVLSYLAVLMLIFTHELGHYIFAAIKGENPKFIVSSEGNWAISYRDRPGENSVLFLSGGMIANFLFLPIFIGMGVMDMEPWHIALLIIGGSMSDIAKIVKELRKRESTTYRVV